MIASSLAAEIYGLKVAKADIEDAQHNTTRFVVLAAKPERVRAGRGPVITSFVFRMRNVPAVLYKALGGFATNSVNMTKLSPTSSKARSTPPCSMPTSKAIPSRPVARPGMTRGSN